MRQSVEISLFSFTDALLGETLALDVRVMDENATLADLLAALDAFAAERFADCRGCDGCCHERAPLIAADLPALAALLPAAEAPAHAVCAAFASLTVDKNGAADITLQRTPGGACRFLHLEEKYCRIWPSRPFVCRSHFCLPRSVRFSDLRESIVNSGENELTRLLLAEEAIGAPPLSAPLAAQLDPTDYPRTSVSDQLSYAALRLRDCVPGELWQRLRSKTDPAL